jgi:AmmeMemoRadiSam system protein B
MVRLPAVAGRFYSDQTKDLALQVESYSVAPAGSGRRCAIACLVPHAGYRFSGHVVGAVYARLELPRRFLLLGPRHYPRGEAQAILSEGAWQTPLGLAEIDTGLATELKRRCPSLIEDAEAHRNEHALEVQLPFLQSLASDFRFVPIALATTDYGQLESLGRAIAAALAKQAEPVLIVASSDMNHYESDEITRGKDRKALDQLLALEPRGLYEVVRREGITMCGFGPAVSMLTAARLLGAAHADLVCYATSGDTNGDRDEVVGYAGVIVD